MKKALTLIGIVALMIMTFIVIVPQKAEAADVYLLPITDDSSNCWISAREAPYTIILFDTLTFSAAIGDSTLSLGANYYNFSFKSWNGAADSGSVTIAFGGHEGRWHADSVSRNLAWSAVGLNTADDYFFAPIGANTIYVRPVVGGDHDSTCCLEIKAYR